MNGSFNDTLPETNIAPENGCLEEEFPFWEGLFKGRTVSFREGIFCLNRLKPGHFSSMGWNHHLGFFAYVPCVECLLITFALDLW